MPTETQTPQAEADVKGALTVVPLEDGTWLFIVGEEVESTHPNHTEALAAALDYINDDATFAQLAEGGLLDDVWESVEGIAFSELTGDGRDFRETAWSWRDPNVSRLPLMLQQETSWGHDGAVLCGYLEVIRLDDAGTTHASGRFYDNEAGIAARDLLLDGRNFGVSVDAGAVEATEECLEFDDDGWCIDFLVTFEAYEIIGLTMTPFPAFARASITLGGKAAGDDSEDEDADAGEPVAASAGQIVAAATIEAIKAGTPVAEFDLPEPQLGQRWEFGLGTEWLIPQAVEGAYAVPLTILDDRTMFGHLAYWGACHVGIQSECVETPMPDNYDSFHLGTCASGGRDYATGPLTMGTDHPALNIAPGRAIDHYAHTGTAWADVRVSNGTYGPWVAGRLRPEVTDAQIDALRAGSLSGDWRRLAAGSYNLSLIAIIAVNTPGFQIRREVTAAARIDGLTMLKHRTKLQTSDTGIATALAGANVVRRKRRTGAQKPRHGLGAPNRAAKARRRPQGRPDGTTDALAARVDDLEREVRELNRERLARRLAAGRA